MRVCVKVHIFKCVFLYDSINLALSRLYRYSGKCLVCACVCKQCELSCASLRRIARETMLNWNLNILLFI